MAMACPTSKSGNRPRGIDGGGGRKKGGTGRRGIIRELRRFLGGGRKGEEERSSYPMLSFRPPLGEKKKKRGEGEISLRNRARVVFEAA